jgi:hypothetical protein
MASAMLLSAVAFAQAQQDNGDSGSEEAGKARNAMGSYELGLGIGSLLPSGITGVTQILGLGQVHAGVRVSDNAWWEANYLMGNGSDQSWKNIDTNLRLDIPVENLVGIGFFGLDVVDYSGPGKSSTFTPGVHAGCGIQALLGGTVWFRGDMKYEVGPGDSLYIGMAIIIRFGAGGGSGGGQN